VPEQGGNAVSGMVIEAQTALVTGSSRGIGRGIALKLAECGIKRVGVHYLKNKGAAEETVGKLRERGAEGFLIQADVIKVDDITRMFAQARELLGSLDIFISNARPDVGFCQRSRQ
jgi:enoyl-[acyl-carrier protein] reductase III